MSNSEKHQPPHLNELSRRTGLIVRPIDDGVINALFARLEKYDPNERAQTYDYLRRVIDDTRHSIGAEPVFAHSDIHWESDE
jgi:hypothetical protein